MAPDRTPADPRPSRTGWATVAVIRGLIGLIAGIVALFRPDAASLALGASLVVVSLLELAVDQPTADPTADRLRRQRRWLRIGAGVVAGSALIASTPGGSDGEARVVAAALVVLAAVDAWGAFHAHVPGIRGMRLARAALLLTAGVVLLVVPQTASSIVVFALAVGWIVVGAIALAMAVWPTDLRTADGRTPTGLIEIGDAWLRSRDVGDARRDEILDAYDYDLTDRARLSRFSVLLVLASVIASAGLIANSVASIIGAMIIAPLMGPIVGIALGIVTGLPRRAMESLIVTAAGIVATVLIGVILGAWLGSGPNVPDNSEIVGRTSPTIIDLVVALAAGAAGAYAASNAKVADSLPGVAIAISLVPPLATAGILLSAGLPDEAAGALLLFATNFVSIVLAASVVFVLTGVVPVGRLVANAERTQLWFASFGVAGMLLLIPLAVGGQQAYAAATDEQIATDTVRAWLAPAPGFVVLDVTVAGHEVDVAVAGPGTAPDPVTLESMLNTALGPPITLDLVITPTVVYSTPASPVPSATP